MGGCMSWALGWDDNWQRWIGYGVPAYCDHPDCNKEIDRGLAYVCSRQQPYGGEDGCGLFFCKDHRDIVDGCERCEAHKDPFVPSKEHPKWINHLLTDESWREWREENPELVEALK